jgi:uncharacterized protein YceH (UPF0502 family)
MSTLPLLLLNPLEARVLGCLLEKEMATPEYYPLTLSSLAAACNQKSNRDPVMAVGEAVVEQTLELLRREKKMASLIREAGARVPKYRHELQNKLALSDVEKAVLAELLLRGPQTPAELRARAARMAGEVSAEQIDQALASLDMVAGIRVVAKLPRASGRREARFAHQLCGEVLQETDEPLVIEAPTPPDLARLEALETEVQGLRAELAALRADFAAFRLAFE